MKKLMKLVKNEDGATLVFVALLMVVLLGFAALVVDIGNVTLTKARLQNAADSAALAGAKDITNVDTAVKKAVDYSRENGLNVLKGKIVPVSENVFEASGDDTDKDKDLVTVTTPYNGDTKKIEVVCARIVPYIFAGVLGVDTINVSACAVAQKLGVSGISGLRPWALKQDYNYTYGLQFELKVGGSGGSNGYYGITSFGTQGGDANTYKGNITNGYNGIVNIDDSVNAPLGNMNEKNVINDLITKSGDTSNDYSKAQIGNSRVILVPKINASFKVIGFAVLYINSVDNQGFITATFLYDTTWSEEEQDLHYDWGLSKVKLIK